MGDAWRTNFLHADAPVRAVIPCLPPLLVEDFFAYADARIDLARSMSNGAFWRVEKQAERAIATIVAGLRNENTHG